ncbi:MAG TPA: TonB family protein [Kofleriaceae bacterium]|nr:TonB family protein [Kofleriaceae bacterium]
MVLHAGFLGTVSAFGVELTGQGFSTKASTDLAALDPDIELQTTCSGDALLATGARAVMCLAPWRGDVEGCVDDVPMNLWMDLSSCRGTSDAVAAVAMITPREAAKLTPIDPEPLLDELQPPPEEPKPQQPVPPPKPENQPPPPPPPPQQQRPMNTQIVETAKQNQETPNNARFLSENDIKVDKQTVARGARNEPMVAKSKPEELAVKDTPKDDPSVAKQPDPKPEGKNEKAPEAPGKLSMRAPGAIQPNEAPQDQKTRGAATGGQNPIVSDGFVPRRGDGAVEQQRRDPGELTKGQGGAGGGAPPVPDLKENKEVLERIAGGGSVDHLEDVESGDETALNAKRWVYASFFNRLKRQVAQNWDPQTVWRRADPNGAHHGFKTRVTEVRVSLARNGKLTKIVVTAPSGVSALDDEAVRAFQAAAPFPNPPDGLVKNEQITFAFSFYFEIGQPRTSWRVIR